VVDQPIKGLTQPPIDTGPLQVKTPHGEAMAEGYKKTMSERQVGYTAANLAANKLNQDTISLLTYAVARYTDTVEDTVLAEDGAMWYSDAALDTVYILSIAKEFKYGNGYELVAITDGGKNQWNKPVKYVKYFYQFAANDKNPKGTVKANDKTYTFSHEKAKEMWETKIKEGYKRVK